MDKNAVRTFYNEYVPRQKSVGVNIRHLSILDRLKSAGLQSHSSVLEIGCGIGTLTSLLARVVRKGHIVATDISDESVNEARRVLKRYKNIEFIAADVLDMGDIGMFDMIVMADVIEHIPQELHPAMFKSLSNMMSPGSVIALNLPFPPFNAWAAVHRPEHMQVIDQAVHTNELLNAAYPAGLHIHLLETYTLWMLPYDYQWILLHKNERVEAFHPISKFQVFMKLMRMKYGGGR